MMDILASSVCRQQFGRRRYDWRRLAVCELQGDGGAPRRCWGGALGHAWSALECLGHPLDSPPWLPPTANPIWHLGTVTRSHDRFRQGERNELLSPSWIVSCYYLLMSTSSTAHLRPRRPCMRTPSPLNQSFLQPTTILQWQPKPQTRLPSSF